MSAARIAVLVLIAACDRSGSSRTSGFHDASPPAASGAMAENLESTAAGVMATWIEPADGSSNVLRVRFASYAAAGWSAASTIAESDAIVANWADVPSVARQLDGTLVAHWAQKAASDPYAYDVMVARSTDRGRTWQPLGRTHRDGTPTEHGFVSLLAERDRTAAVWLDGRGSVSGGPTTLRTATIAGSIGEETIIDDRVCDCCSTAAAMTAEGPVVVYRDRSTDEIRDPWIARLVGGVWTAHPVHADGWRITGCPVNGPAVAARDRDVVVAWFTYADQIARVRVAFSRDAGASFAPPIDVDVPRGTHAPVGRVDVVIDGGDALVSWIASEREAGQILVRRVGRDGRLGRELAVARVNAGRGSGFPELARFGDAELLVMWTETSGPSRLRAARFAKTAVPPLAGSQPVASANVESVAVGAAAPDYRAETLAGTTASLRDLRGTPSLLNVWATWCEPCRHELPVIQKLHARFGPRGLRVVASSVDHEASRDDVAAFAKRRGLAIDLWIDREDRASRSFGIATLPVTMLFDDAGTLVWRRDGAITDGDRELEAAIERVLDHRRTR